MSTAEPRRTGPWTIGLIIMGALILITMLVCAGLLGAGFLVANRAANKVQEQEQALRGDAEGRLAMLISPLNFYSFDVGKYPTTAEGLAALREKPAGAEGWQGPYLDEPLPHDPWNNAYQYAFPGTHNPDSFDVWSWGPDGKNGTPDDIGNWNWTPLNL